MAGPSSRAPERRGLTRLFDPRAVAVLGSAKAGRIGHQLLTQLIAGGFAGQLYAVNPGAEAPADLSGVEAFASVAAVPAAVDLALVAVPAAHAEAAVRQCGAAGIGAAVVFTSGFGEVGRTAEEQALAEAARAGGVRLVGPNCAGVMNTGARLFASIEVRALPGRAAFVTQSGAVGGAVLALAAMRGIGFSKFVSYGNRADLGEVELLDYLAADPDTELIALYLESLQDGREFMAAVRRAAAAKPVLIIKAGRSSAGLRAAGSHTGSLAGSDRVFEAMVRQSGALRVAGMEEMLDLCCGFASLPAPRGNRIAVVTNSGGPGILTSDRAEALGLAVAETSPGLRGRLAGFLPSHCAMGNPIDLTVEGTGDNYRRVLEEVLADEYDGAIAINVGTPFLDSEALARGIAEARPAAGHDKPVAAVFMAGEMVQAGTALLAEAGIPSFPTGERAACVLASMHDYARRRAHLGAAPGGAGQTPGDRLPEPLPLSAPILEPDAVKFLADQGFPFPEHSFVAEAARLEAAIARVGLPAVMKVVSPQILHKSDVGGVILGLDSPEVARQAFEDTKQRFSDRDIRGVMLYRQLGGEVELIAGLKRDPDFGPVVLVGSGGVLAEVLSDVTMRIAPFDRSEALAMLSELKAFRLLQGYRGQPPRDVDAAADLLVRLSQLGLAYPEIGELDLNPVFVLEEGAVIADARILRV